MLQVRRHRLRSDLTCSKSLSCDHLSPFWLRFLIYAWSRLGLWSIRPCVQSLSSPLDSYRPESGRRFTQASYPTTCKLIRSLCSCVLPCWADQLRATKLIRGRALFDSLHTRNIVVALQRELSFALTDCFGKTHISSFCLKLRVWAMQLSHFLL